MRKLIYTLSLVGGLLSASTLHAQGIFSTAELSRSSRSISMGGITSVSGPNAFSVYENASAVAFSDKKLEAGVGAGVRVLSRVQLDFSYLLAKGESPFKDTYAIGFCVLF